MTNEAKVVVTGCSDAMDAVRKHNLIPGDYFWYKPHELSKFMGYLCLCRSFHGPEVVAKTTVEGIPNKMVGLGVLEFYVKYDYVIRWSVSSS